jgi:1-acyl-sn-glycerol-3-phosphate acyltransferase
MYELMRLSGQEYVDEYAAVVKARLAGKGPEPLHKLEGTEDAVADIAEDRDDPNPEGQEPPRKL